MFTTCSGLIKPLTYAGLMRSRVFAYVYPIPHEFRKPMHAPYHLEMAGMKYCIDFSCPEGTHVFAARDGIVVDMEAQYFRAYCSKKMAHLANFVLIRHAGGEESIYGHLKYRSVRVKKGEFVRRGRVIAKSGQTGFAAYPHLHFGVYRAGRSVPVRLRAQRKHLN